MFPLTAGVGNPRLIGRPGRDVGQLGRSGACGVGSRGATYAAWPSGVLHRVSQGVRGVRRLGCRLPTGLHEPNAPNKRDVLGTAVLSMLSGHKRYAHMAALRADGVLPELLGLTRVMSEDAVRRGLKAIPDSEGIGWLSGHLDYCTAPLLGEDWVLDVDTTIKPLYGHQEGAELGYNPKGTSKNRTGPPRANQIHVSWHRQRGGMRWDSRAFFDLDKRLEA